MSRKKITPNQKHLTITDREYIEEALKRNLTFKEIARFLEKDPTTVSKEIKKHRISQKPSSFHYGNQCKYLKSCQQRDLCKTGNCRYPCRQCQNCKLVCPDYEIRTCPKTQKAPFVCNGCDKKSSCHIEKQYYRAAVSQREYEETLVSSREGINMNPDEFKVLDSLIAPLVKQGQSIAHICAAHLNEISCTERTIYHYFDQNLFSVANMDLPRKVRYKKRKSNTPKEPCDYAVRQGRTYQDFLMYITKNPELSIVEMDTVERRKGGKVLLTILIRSCRFGLAFLLEDKTQKSVESCFGALYEMLGEKLFETVFGAILTDNGSEFLSPISLECDGDGVIHTRLFYCDPNSSYQKGMLEKNHEFIRYILPKGSSFDELCQDDITLMMNHINSINRDSLSGKSPFDVAQLLLPDLLSALRYQKIPPSEVLLKPRLLR